MLGNPRRPVAASEIAAIADADARENWTVMIAFRDLLIGQNTVEAAYLDLVRRGMGETPPLFINQLVHVILRNLLDRCDDVFMLRAAELFFRPQRLTVHDGSLIAADEEKVTGVSPQPASPLVAILGLPVAGEIDVLNDGNAESYWERSDLFDMALDLTAGRRGLDALGKVIEQWITHLLSVEVEIESLIEATNVNLTWYVGLDAEATGIGDALWTGGELDQAVRERIIGLYRLTFRNPEAVLDKAKGEPIYLILAMTSERMLRMKPPNLVTGLPRAKPGPKRAAISAMWCRCRRPCAWRSMPSSPSIMLSNRSTSASATAPIRRRWRGADRCRKNANERDGKLLHALVAAQAQGGGGRRGNAVCRCGRRGAGRRAPKRRSARGRRRAAWRRERPARGVARSC